MMIPAAALLALSLSACGGDDGSSSGRSADASSEADSGQTVAEACDIIKSGGEAVSTKMEELSQSMDSKDEEAVNEVVSLIQTELTNVAEDVTNPEVKQAWSDLVEAFGASAIDAANADATGDADAAVAALEKVSTASQKMSELCPTGPSSPMS